MIVFEKGDTTLKDASTRVQEEHGIPHKVKVLVSKDLGKNELVVGLEDLKDIGILHREFPEKMQNSSMSSTTVKEGTNGMSMRK